MRPDPGSEVYGEVQWGVGRGRRGWGETEAEKVELHESEKTLSAKKNDVHQSFSTGY